MDLKRFYPQGLTRLLAILVFPCFTLTGDIRINEFMSSNGATVADEDGDFEDWIELYNAGAEALQLAGWGLSDNLAEPFKWVFPEGAAIAPGEYLLVWASGKDRSGSAAPQQIAPNEIAGLVVWLRADSITASSGQAVATWVDSSGLGNDAVQPVVSQRPAWISGALNGQPALRFDRSSNQQLFLPTTGFNGMQDFANFSFFTVLRWSGGIRSGILGGYRGSNLSNAGSSVFEISETNGTLRLRLPTGIDFSAPAAIGLNQWQIAGAARDGATSTARIYRGAEVLAQASGSVGQTLLAQYDRVPLGSSHDDSRTFAGDIAEAILFNRNLTVAEVSGLNHYLAHKYGMAENAPGGMVHTNFRISAQGEDLLLTRPDGTTADHVPAIAVPRDMSYGRSSADPGQWGFFYAPTPGAVNDSPAFQQLIGEVEFSHPAGFYSSNFALQLQFADPQAVIVFSIDGSDPDIDNIGGKSYAYINSYPNGPQIQQSYRSQLYSQPIQLSNRSSQANKLARISSVASSSPDHIPSQRIKKSTVVRARAYVDGTPGPIRTATYFVAPDAAFDYQLPIVSLSLSEDRLFDFVDGIYVAGIDHITSAAGSLICNYANHNRRGSIAERSAHLEYFHAGELAFDQPIGIRIQGNCSRRNPFKSLRIYSRGTGDNPTFSYPFFDSSPPGASNPGNQDFNRLILRAPNFNDTVFSRLYQGVYEGVGGRMQPVIKFINGEYWGIAMLRDRIDPYHFHHHYGLDPDNLTVIVIRYLHEYIGPPLRFSERVYELSAGIPDDMDAYMAMRDFISNGNMTDAALFAEAESLLCMDSFIDHLILKIFAGDDHYAPEFVFWRARQAENDSFGDGRWRVFIKDFDSTLFTGNFVQGLATGTHPRSFGYEMFASLLRNTGFRNRFINRFADLLNSHFLTQRFEQIINDSYDEIIPYWSEMMERWNNTSVTNPDRPFTSTNRQSLINWARQQPGWVRGHMRSYFGLPATRSVTLRVDDTRKGHLQINSIRIDPSTPGVAESPYPWSGSYFPGVPVTVVAIPAPKHRFLGWVSSPTSLFQPPGDNPNFSSTDPVLIFDPTLNTTVQAVFEPIPENEFPQVTHFWDFEVSHDLFNPAYSTGTALLQVESGVITDVLSNTDADFPSRHLRVNNPLDKSLILHVPSSGHRNLRVEWLTRRSGQGAAIQSVAYTTDGALWNDFTAYEVFDGAPRQQVLDFSAIAAVNDNPNFALRIRFSRSESQLSDHSGLAGNNRFDDIRMIATPLPGSSRPATAVFIPSGSADWSSSDNWNTLEVPDGGGAAALLPAARIDRNVDLRQPVTIGHLSIDNVDSAARNRIRDLAGGNTLTFASDSMTAALQIHGTGSGWVELEVAAGTILQSDLRIDVQNINGNPEYGALRMRASWDGPGSLLKDGPGIASLTGFDKLFRGALRIESGVLSLTQPATPSRIAALSVRSGAQLRLISASSIDEPVRHYSFPVALQLSGSGWADGPPDLDRGVLGALRYQPGIQNSIAALDSAVFLAADAGIHVDGRFNQLIISGPIFGPGNLSKSGGGQLTLAGDCSSLRGNLSVHNGSLVLATNTPATIELDANATLSGTGSVADLIGSGTVILHSGLLHADTISGPAFVAWFDSSADAPPGTLFIRNPHASALQPASIDLILSSRALASGERLRGGISVPNAVDLRSYLETLPLRLLIEDPAGPIVSGGINTRAATAADPVYWRVISSQQGTSPASIVRQTIEILPGSPPTSFAAWLDRELSDPSQRHDPNFAATDADPFQTGIANLLRYGLDMTIDEPGGPRMPAVRLSTQSVVLRFPLNSNLLDLAYTVESSTDLIHWVPVFDSLDSNNLQPINGWVDLPVESLQQQFFRLSVAPPPDK